MAHCGAAAPHGGTSAGSELGDQEPGHSHRSWRCHGRRGALLAVAGLAPLGLLVGRLQQGALPLLLPPAQRRLSRANSTASASPDTCGRVTDGVCRLLPCKSWRGQTDCVGSACVCKPGFCANDYGVCVAPPGSCPKDTGSGCGWFGCGSSLGPTSCVNGRCVCAEGTCANAEGFCSRPNRSECAGAPGQRCLGFVDWWCPANSECSHTRCKCRPGYCASVSGRCLPQEDACDRDTGGSCRFLRCDGFRGPTVCRAGKCVCKPGFCAKDIGTGYGVCTLRRGRGAALSEGAYVASVAEVSQLHPRFPPPHDQISAAVAFSGGGWRAFSSALGSLRALHHLGLMRDVDALSSVSGGTWATAVYMFANMSAESLLGPMTTPENLTLRLADGDPPPLGRPATAGLRPWLMGLRPMPRAQDLWPDFVARTFLEPFGLGSRAAFMAGSRAAVRRIVRENPALVEAEFLTPVAGRPPVYIMGGVLGAPAGYETEPGNVAYFEMSPDWIGSPFWPGNDSVVYPPTEGNGLGPERVRVGGGLVESFAFGGRKPRRVRVERPITGPTWEVRLPPPFQPFSLATAASVSSCAYLSLFQKMPLGLDFALPQRRVWPIGGSWPGARGRGLIHKLGDGGNMENTGLLQLLQRGARRVAVFTNSEQALTVHAYDFCRGNATEFHASWFSDKVDVALSSFFGLGTDSVLNGFTSHNQVFPSTALAPTLCAMQRQKRRGQPIVHRARLPVLPNSWWGIVGNYTLDIVFSYLDAAPEFEGRLPPETRGSLPEGFPFLPTVPLPDLRLSNREVQLLSAQSEYAVAANADLFRDVLSRKS